MSCVSRFSLAAAVFSKSALGGSHESVNMFPHCPNDYCLERIYEGNAVNSFQCTQYPDVGYQCAMEGLPCPCDGYVKYGNYVEWSEEHESTGLIQCGNDVFGDPVSGAKFCFCRPRNPVATVKSTDAGCDPMVPDHCPATGYEEPTCVNANVKMHLAVDSFKDLEFFEGVCHFGLGYAFGALTGQIAKMPPPMTEVQTMDTENMDFVVKVPADGDLKGIVAMFDLVDGPKENAAPLKTALTEVLTVHADALGDLAMLGAVVTFEVPASPSLPTTATTTATTTTVASTENDASDASSFASGALSVIGLSMVGHML